MSKMLRDDSLLADAHITAGLFSDGLIAADKQLDVIGGSAGGILGLLRLYRDSKSTEVLDRAIKCGEHLIAQGRLGREGLRSWVGQGMGKRALNGMSPAPVRMRLIHWQWRRAGKTLRQQPQSALPLKARASMRAAITGRICAVRGSRPGLANGVMERPASDWRALRWRDTGKTGEAS
jgi:hypothetical protein